MMQVHKLFKNRKLVSCLLVVLLMITSIPITAMADSDNRFEIQDLNTIASDQVEQDTSELTEETDTPVINDKEKDKELSEAKKEAEELKKRLMKSISFDTPKEKTRLEPETVYIEVPGEGYQPYMNSVVYQTLKKQGRLDIFDEMVLKNQRADALDGEVELIQEETTETPPDTVIESVYEETPIPETGGIAENIPAAQESSNAEQNVIPDSEGNPAPTGQPAAEAVPDNSSEPASALDSTASDTTPDNPVVYQVESNSGTTSDENHTSEGSQPTILPESGDQSVPSEGEVTSESQDAVNPSAEEGATPTETEQPTLTETTDQPATDNGQTNAETSSDPAISSTPDPVQATSTSETIDSDKKTEDKEEKNEKPNRYAELEPLVGSDTVDLMSTTSTDKAYYNTLVGPSAMNGVDNEQYAALRDTEEVISPITGDLTLKTTDISLPGRNGLDLKLSRIYQSNQAMFGDRKVGGDGVSGYNGYSTYYQDRYNLGVGWSWGFPSVQIEKDEDLEELYFHTGDGAVYHVVFTDNPDDSNLEKYVKTDIKFEKDTTYNNGQVTSAYVLIMSDQSKAYFGSDGRYMATVDRFNNQIVLNHVELPIANLVANGDFENNQSNAWNWHSISNPCFEYSTTNGKDDTTSLKYHYVSGSIRYCDSDNIAVEPNTKYYYSFYINDQLSGGQASCTVYQYSSSGEVKSSTTISATQKNVWQFKEGYITTGSSTRYISLTFKGTAYSGSAYYDKARLDRTKPLISKITDSIGREINFTYTDTMYDDTGNAGTITMVVNNPAKTDSATYTYTRGRNVMIIGSGEDADERRYPTLFSSDDGETQDTYSYTNQNVSWRFSGSDEVDPTSGVQTILTDFSSRNSKTHYEYEKVIKFLGYVGYREVYRILNRREFPQTDTGYSAIAQMKRDYSFVGNNGQFDYDEETGWPGHINPQFRFDRSQTSYYYCNILQDNGLHTEILHHGSDIGFRKGKITTSNSSGETDVTTYESYDEKYLDQPTLIKTHQTDGTSNGDLLTGYTYNDWGGLESETRPLTQAQWDNATVKEQNTIQYTYDPTYRFLTSKTYYQNEGTQLTESSNYDMNGRLQSSVNAKGETTDYQYEDTAHLGNVTKVVVNHDGNRTSTTGYDYSGAYYAYPTTITQYYTANNQAQTSTTEKTYEFVRGQVLSTEDAGGHITSNTFDDLGRLTKVTYPSSEGINGSYTVEDNYDYADYTVADLDNRTLFKVHQYRTWDDGSGPETFSETVGYYDDHGVLQQNRQYDFDKSQWNTTRYGFNNYGQITSTTDPLNHQTGYTWDEWNRLMSITDAQGNHQDYEYDIVNRTKKSSFVPQATGVAENHHLVSYDQWGREISRKGYPDGWGQANELEETCSYDLLGNLVQATDPRGYTTQYQYDSLNRLVNVINPLNEETGYDYNRLGNISQMTQTEGLNDLTTAKNYDERGLLTSKAEPEGQTVTYNYNQLGLPETVTDATDKVTSMEYDNNNRLHQMSAGPDSLTYYYHPLGGVERTAVYNTQNGAGESLDYQYYSTGQTKQRKIGNYAVDFQYDDAGNRTRITDPFSQAVNYQFDSLNRVNTISVDSKNFSYEYYADGMIKAVNYPNNLRSEYSYDNMNRLTSLTNKLGATTLSSFSYSYDGNGNIISVTTGGQTTTYVYDPLNRLTGIKRPSGEEINYQYDSRGNRSKGSVTTITPSNFKAGEFFYNSWDELASFTGTGTTNYSYDPEGLRTKKESGTNTTRYFCDDNGLVVAESNGTGQVTAQNVWGYKALARKINGIYYYYLYNGHGDVIQVIDENGNAVNSYSYDEWGNVLTAQEQINNPMKYAGEYFDDETGLYYLRARYYDPSIGRFISKDTYEGEITNPLSINQYTYCSSNPINRWDPSGHWALNDIVSSASGWISEHTSLSQNGSDSDSDSIYDSISSAYGFLTQLYNTFFNVGDERKGGSDLYSDNSLGYGPREIWNDFYKGASEMQYIPGTIKDSCSDTWNDPNTGDALIKTGVAVVTVVPACVGASFGAGAYAGYGTEIITVTRYIYFEGKCYIQLHSLGITRGTMVIVDIVSNDGLPPETIQGTVKDLGQEIYEVCTDLGNYPVDEMITP